jgi:uncharacterized repeat protein (TIGR02543 family)
MKKSWRKTAAFVLALSVAVCGMSVRTFNKGGFIKNVIAVDTAGYDVTELSDSTVKAAEISTSDNIKECSDSATLKSLLQNASDGDIIKVTADFNGSDLVSAKVPVKEGCLVTLDLNGHTITFERGGDVFGTQANSALLVKNGTMDYFDTDNNNSAGIIILCNVQVKNTAWLGSATTWVVNGSSIAMCSSEAGRVNPGSELNPIGNNYNAAYQYDNPAPAMIGSGVTWSCYQDLKTDFEKANADSETNSNVLLLKDSVLAEDADLTASGIVMDFSEFKLTNGDHSFSISNNEGTNTIRNGTLDGDITLTSGDGNVSISNMTVTGEITNKTHSVDISGGFYNDISTDTGKVTITDGYFKGKLSGNSYEISGGYFVDRTEDSFMKDGYVAIDCSETVDGVLYNYKVVEGYIVSFDANGGETTAKKLYIEKDKAVGTLPDAEYEYHSFDGWFTEAENGTEVTDESVLTSNATLYAHWTQVEEPPTTTSSDDNDQETTTTTASSESGNSAATTSASSTAANSTSTSSSTSKASSTTTSTSKTTTAANNNSSSYSPSTGDKGIPSTVAGMGIAALAMAAGAYALSKKKDDDE